MWRALIRTVFTDVEFNHPAKPDQIERAERELRLALPDELKELLRESNGVSAHWGSPLVWSTDDLVEQNRVMRRTREFADLYMTFDNLLFFGADGGGDLFGYRILGGRIGETSGIYVWRHETDNREWFASNLNDYVRRSKPEDE